VRLKWSASLRRRFVRVCSKRALAYRAEMDSEPVVGFVLN